MFVDASAIVAILTSEPEADTFSDLLQAARSAFTSPVAIFEAVLGICRKRQASVEQTEQHVHEFLELAGIEVFPVTARDAETALKAFSRYGKGRGHRAQLNLADCFAYAMAKNHSTPLLFKGDDFDKTDVRSAAAPRRFPSKSP